MKKLLIVFVLLVCGCSHRAVYRTNTAARGFAAMACGSTGGTFINGDTPICLRNSAVVVVSP